MQIFTDRDDEALAKIQATMPDREILAYIARLLGRMENTLQQINDRLERMEIRNQNAQSRSVETEHRSFSVPLTKEDLSD